MLPCVCSVIDHRWRQNVVRTKKWPHFFLPHLTRSSLAVNTEFHLIWVLNERSVSDVGKLSLSSVVGDSQITLRRDKSNFYECFYTSIETRRTCFLLLLENNATKKGETTSLLWSSKCKFSLRAPSVRLQLVLVLCLHRVIETRFLTNQLSYFLKAVF